LSGDRPEAAALFAALERGAPVGVAVFDEALRPLLVSPSLPAGMDAELAVGAREVLSTARPRLGVELAAAGRSWVAGWYPLERAGRRMAAAVLLDVTEREAAAAALRESRERLAAAQRLAQLGSYAWDAAGDEWAWSEQLFRLAGLDPAAGPPDWNAWLASVAPDSRPRVREATVGAIRDGRPFDLHLGQRRPDGSQRILRAKGDAVRGPDGRPAGVEGFAQDVTDLYRAEAQQRAVAALGQAALGGLPVGELMERATEIVAATLELDHVSVLELEPGGERLVLRAGLGWPAEQIGTREAEVGRASHAGYTMLAGEPVVVEDWAAEQRFAQPPILAAAGVRSGACVIIGESGTPYGTLAAHSRHPGRVGAGHVAFLRAVANVLASAVGRLRAEAEIAEQAAARGRLVAQALDAEDRTRRGISELLHDGPLQDLLALNQELLRLEAPGELPEQHLTRAQTGITRAIRRLREVMVDLHPVAFDVGGLESGLGAVADQLARQGRFACDVHVDPGAGGLRDELVIALVRELLTNAARHAAASRVQVAVRLADRAVVLEVADDGAGIPEGRLRAALTEGHIGIASSLQRVEAVGGTLRIGPGPEGGTTAVAVLPVQPPRER
jgi:signal transduction histidine kinase/PAS domain-containing protein